MTSPGITTQSPPNTISPAGSTEVEEATRALTWVADVCAAAGPNVLIAAPGAGTRIVISTLVLQNESATATTMILQSAANDLLRCLGENPGDGIALQCPPGREIRCGVAEALNLDLSGANSCGYSVGYWVE